MNERVFLVGKTAETAPAAAAFRKLSATIALTAHSTAEAWEKAETVNKKGITAAIVAGSIDDHASDGLDGVLVGCAIKRVNLDIVLVYWDPVERFWGDLVDVYWREGLTKEHECRALLELISSRHDEDEGDETSAPRE